MSDFLKRYLNNNCSEEDLTSVIDLFVSPDNKKELEQKKEFEKNILMLAKDISSGRLVIKDGIAIKELKYKINDKDTGAAFLESVSFDKRLTAKDKDDIIAKVKKDDTGSAMDAIKAIIAKKVGLDVAIINKIDSQDYKILQAIGTIFF